MPLEKNQVMQALPADVRERWCAHGQWVNLKVGDVLCTDTSTIDHLYLPTSAVIAWLKLLESGDTALLVMTGRDNLFGMTALMGHDVPATQAVVQCSGLAWRVPLAMARRDYEHHPAVRSLLLQQYKKAFSQLCQLAICNRFHSLEQQLCRLLLMTGDRLDSPQVPMTHEHIASLMGARREGVSNAVGRLMRAGLVRSLRGCIHIEDRAGLHRRSCECYDMISVDPR